MPKLDLQNASLWEEIYSVSKSAEYTSSAVYKPIEPIVVPIQLTAQLVATFTDSNNAPPSWYSAGFMQKEISIGIFVGANQNTKYGYSRRVPLRKAQVTLWENFGESYKLTFRPHKWFDNISFSIWEYTGKIEELAVEQVEALGVNLLRIERTLQFVANRDVPTTYTGTVRNDVPPQS